MSICHGSIVARFVAFCHRVLGCATLATIFFNKDKHQGVKATSQHLTPPHTPTQTKAGQIVAPWQALLVNGERTRAEWRSLSFFGGMRTFAFPHKANADRPSTQKKMNTTTKSSREYPHPQSDFALPEDDGTQSARL